VGPDQLLVLSVDTAVYLGYLTANLDG